MIFDLQEYSACFDGFGSFPDWPYAGIPRIVTGETWTIYGRDDSDNSVGGAVDDSE